jgi:hypothetical protein
MRQIINFKHGESVFRAPRNLVVCLAIQPRSRDAEDGSSLAVNGAIRRSPEATLLHSLD